MSFLDVILLINYGNASLKCNFVIKQLSNCVIWFRVKAGLIITSCVRSDKRPDDSDNSRADTTLGEELKLKLLNAEHLVNFLSLGKTTVVKVFVLWFGNLQTNSHLMLLSSLLDMHLFDILFYCKSIQNILVIFSLMILTELITHDNRTLGSLRLAPSQIVMIEWRSLQIHHSAIKLRILQYLVKLLRWRLTPHYNHIGIHCSMIRVKALLEKVVNCVWLTVSE